MRQTIRTSKAVATAKVDGEPQDLNPAVDDDAPVEQTNKTFWERTSPVIACGSGLFSDGYTKTMACERFFEEG